MTFSGSRMGSGVEWSVADDSGHRNGVLFVPEAIDFVVDTHCEHARAHAA